MDIETGENHAEKTNGTANGLMPPSLDAACLESDHDFPTDSGLTKFLHSPAMATSWCIYLCFILKSVQQVTA